MVEPTPQQLAAEVERAVVECKGYEGLLIRNGLLILCHAMAVALLMLWAIYANTRRGG